MIYGLWLSTAGLQVNEYRQSVIANNIANADTAGFKRDLAVVRDRDVESKASPFGRQYAHRVLDGLPGGSFARPTHTIFEPGALEETSRPLDLAIDGEGFFAVDAQGQTRYTRDGRFLRAGDGTLRMAAGGHAVLDTSGMPITLDPQAPVSSIRITEEGRVFQEDQLVGQLAVKDFADKSLLRKTGGNLLANLGSAESEATGLVKSGAVEKSNVSAVQDMVHMIEATRAYQMNASLIQIQDEMLRRAVNDVGKVG
jgi:flagellar basal-body rod protein FlgG